MTNKFAPAWNKVCQLNFPRSVPFTDNSKFVVEFGEAPMLHTPIDNMIQRWEVTCNKLVSVYGIPPPDQSIQTEETNLENCWARIYTPPNSSEYDPVGLYFHGGGWSMGGVDQEDSTCRLISKQCQMKIVSVEYRLAPQFKYPKGLDDCVEGTIWTLEHFNVKSVTLIGTSSGANSAFGVALRLIDQGMADHVKGVIALAPCTVHPDAVPSDMKARYTSYDEHAYDTVNTAPVMREFWHAYGVPPSDPYGSSLLHSRLGLLNKVYIAECCLDTLRDDARLMKEVLEKENVQLRYSSYPGYPHYSWSYPSTHLDEHRNEFNNSLMEAVKWMNRE
jgi:versiconal hemiacetal acetate esterase